MKMGQAVYEEMFSLEVPINHQKERIENEMLR